MDRAGALSYLGAGSRVANTMKREHVPGGLGWRVAILLMATACVGRDWPVSPLGTQALHGRALPEIAALLPAPDPRDGDYAKTGGLRAVLARVDSVASSLRAAMAEAVARGEEVEVAKSQYWGAVTPFASTEQLDAARLVSPLSPPVQIQSISFDDQQYHLGVRATLPLDLSGRIGAEVRGAAGAHHASLADVEDLRRRILNSAAQLFRGLQTLGGVRSALQTKRDALLAHLTSAKEAVRVGRMAHVEELRLLAERDKVLAQLAGLDGQDAALRARLAALMRVDSYGTKIKPPAVTPPAIDSERMPWSHRPDLVAARFRVESAAEAVRASAARRLPQVALQGSAVYNRGYSTDGDGLGQVGLFVEWPVFDGGLRAAKQRAARARYGASLQRLQRLTDAARAEVTAAQSTWRAVGRRYNAALSAAKAARETVAIQARRFQEGRLSAADLVDAEATRSNAEAEAVASLVAWWSADDALQLARGRFAVGYVRKSQEVER